MSNLFAERKKNELAQAFLNLANAPGQALRQAPKAPERPAATARTRPAPTATSSPRLVQVRAHARAAPAKPPPTATAASVNTQSVRPAQVSTAKRFAPHYHGEPVAGWTGGLRNPDGSWAVPGGRAVPGAYLAERPYYTDVYTSRHHHGPTGQEDTQWNAAQVAAARKIQAENYGKPGYVLRSLIPGGLDEGGTTSVGRAALRSADVISSVLPGGGVGEAAGLLGVGLLKGLRGARAVKDVAEAAPKAVHAAEEAATVRGAMAGAKEPPVAPGHVRLYRGEPVMPPVPPAEDVVGRADYALRYRVKPKRGNYFTPDRRVAENFAKNANTGYPGQLLYVDVPKSSLEGEGALSQYVLPADVAGRARAFVAPSAAVVRGGMKGAKILRGKQEAGYSIERGKRVAAARVHLENPNLPPAERIRLAKGELAGELPKINFQGFKELNDESLKALQTHILEHPHLLPFQKLRATEALTNALTGRVPTRSEITLLEHVFGKETANGLGAMARHPFRDTLANVLNIPRSLMASFDLSAPFRQGLMVATRHPTIFARNFRSMIKAFGSEKVYQGILDEIHARPTYPMMMEAKLPFTELGRDIGGREERFASDYAEKLTGGKYGPVRASGRAYTGFLDKTRADVFDHLIQRAQAQGINVQDPHFLRSLGKYIGSATGRGDLGAFQEAAPLLNGFLFSPRLLASRLNFLNPAYYARLDPFARKEALRSGLQLAGTLSTVLALASRVPGVKVATDPRNPDWGKIRIGNTRLDIAGGFQQELRLLAQLATGVAISSTTGKKLNLTAGGFGDPTRLDIAQRFFMGKESPIASLVTDWARNSNQIGEPFSWRSAVTQRMIPLLGQDSYDLYKEGHGGVNGLARAFAGYGVGSVGIGMQTYGAKPSTAATDTIKGIIANGGSITDEGRQTIEQMFTVDDERKSAYSALPKGASDLDRLKADLSVGVKLGKLSQEDAAAAAANYANATPEQISHARDSIAAQWFYVHELGALRKAATPKTETTSASKG
jgi:hypothetical protein